jgi:hypothetical protein
MAVPSDYTEYTLAGYQQSVIGNVGGVLGWELDTDQQSPGDYQEPVNEALLLYPVSDIANAGDMNLLRACARVAVWRAVIGGLVAYYDFSDGTPTLSLKRSQMLASAKEALAIAEDELKQILPPEHPANLGAGYAVKIRSMDFLDDPYRLSD